jgi:hypothetical protein
LRKVIVVAQQPRSKRWLDSWLHSDLIGIPVTLAAVAVIAISAALYLVIGKWGGLFVGKLLFVALLGGLLGLIALLSGRRGDTIASVRSVPASGHRHVLVIANKGLESEALCERVCSDANGHNGDAMIVAPVVASSRLHALADDVDQELEAARLRIDGALWKLRAAGMPAGGHADIGDPMTSLIDGLREFPATEVVMVHGGERGWPAADQFAERVRTELGLPVTQFDGDIGSKTALAV